MTSQSFIILGGAELPWIYPLGLALNELGKTTIIRLGASTSIRPPPVNWPFAKVPLNFQRLSWNYPPGFNGTFSSLFTWLIRARFRNVIENHYKAVGEEPFVITPYPQFFKYVGKSDPSRLIYLNYDDLAVAGKTGEYTYLAAENKLAQQAGTIFCCSQFQTMEFRSRFKDKSDRIFHSPHGINPSFINPEPLSEPKPNTICIMGALSSRYDWSLIYQVVKKLPSFQFSFIGNIDKEIERSSQEEWAKSLKATLYLPNVSHVKGLPYRDTASYYWQSTVNWMPYRSDLRFVQASCPLKLMDGLASGRPIISADVPECRLYAPWVKIYQTVDEAVALLVSASEDSGSQRLAQVQFAANNTWGARAEKIIQHLP
jgi:glycosyltransferase involved in cell wall biosynthesis